jgi:hypothetical protein
MAFVSPKGKPLVGAAMRGWNEVMTCLVAQGTASDRVDRSIAASLALLESLQAWQ